MKTIKTLLVTATALSSLLLGSCGEPTPQGELITLDDYYGMTLKEAKLDAAGEVLFDVNEIPTQELVEGRVLGYKDKEVGDQVVKGSRVTLNVAKRVDSAISNYPENSIINYHSVICKLTGPDSINDEVTFDAGIRGTDLGIPFETASGDMMLLYGDSFSNENMSGMWWSNFMAKTSDTNLADGLTFDSIVTAPNGIALPFAQGQHNEGSEENTGSEVTKIPTGGISVNGNDYIFYMSIRYWGVGGAWLVSYNQCLKATDDTHTEWVEVPSLRWNEEELYYAGQIYPFHNPKDEEHIYFTSIPGGRFNGAIMFRVDVNNFENRSEYEYLVGDDNWVKGDEGMAQLNSDPYFIMSPSVAEPSIIYSEYLDKFIFTTLRGSNIVFALSDEVTGPYDDIHAVISGSDYPLLYGGFLHPKFSDTNGQRLYLQLSRWVPIYNTSLVEVVLK